MQTTRNRDKTPNCEKQLHNLAQSEKIVNKPCLFSTSPATRRTRGVDEFIHDSLRIGETSPIYTRVVCHPENIKFDHLKISL